MDKTLILLLIVFVSHFRIDCQESFNTIVPQSGTAGSLHQSQTSINTNQEEANEQSILSLDENSGNYNYDYYYDHYNGEGMTIDSLFPSEYSEVYNYDNGGSALVNDNQLVEDGNTTADKFESVRNEVLQANDRLNNLNEGQISDNGAPKAVPVEVLARAPAVATSEREQTGFIPEVCLEEGETQIQFEVGGGLVVPETRFPYMVSLQLYDTTTDSFQHFCGGTLLTSTLILTAAHCIYAGNQEFKIYDYRADESKIYGNFSDDANIYVTRSPRCRHLSGTDGRIKASKYYVHPAFTGNSLEGGDLAIVELETPFDYNGPFIQVWPIKPNSPFDGINVVAGWGATNSDEIFDTSLFVRTYEQLRMGILRWMDLLTCKQTIGNYDGFLAGLVDSKVLCFYNKGVDGCRADSGGPLLQLGMSFLNDVPENDVQLGIVSWGPDITCTGQDGLPGLYTNISMYASWVQTIVGLRSQPPPQCQGNLAIYSEPEGDVLLAGSQNPQLDPVACCESCSALDGCNAWVYCYYKNGCQRPDGSFVPREFCELLQFEGQARMNGSDGINVWSGFKEIYL